MVDQGRPVGQEGSEDGSTAVTSAPMVALDTDRDGPHVTTANAHPDLSVLGGGLAYITGGASGIGFALAQESLARGLAAVVIADVEPAAMEAAVRRLHQERPGAEVFGCVVDVSDASSVAASADAVAERFPGMPVSLLAANAGVGSSGSVIYSDPEQWDFVFGVNVTGVHNLLRTFVPRMLKQGAPGSIMATSSQDGICAANGIYGVSKHACTAIMEALHQELRGRLSTHLLCPNVTATNVVTSERNRSRISSSTSSATAEDQAGGSGGGTGQAPNPIHERFQVYGTDPRVQAERVFEAIRTGVHYILAENEHDPGYVRLEASSRADAMLTGGRPIRPTSPMMSQLVFNLEAPLPDRAEDQGAQATVTAKVASATSQEAAAQRRSRL